MPFTKRQQELSDLITKVYLVEYAKLATSHLTISISPRVSLIQYMNAHEYFEQALSELKGRIAQIDDGLHQLATSGISETDYTSFLYTYFANHALPKFNWNVSLPAVPDKRVAIELRSGETPHSLAGYPARWIKEYHNYIARRNDDIRKMREKLITENNELLALTLSIIDDRSGWGHWRHSSDPRKMVFLEAAKNYLQHPSQENYLNYVSARSGMHRPLNPRVSSSTTVFQVKQGRTIDLMYALDRHMVEIKAQETFDPGLIEVLSAAAIAPKTGKRLIAS